MLTFAFRGPIAPPNRRGSTRLPTSRLPSRLRNTQRNFHTSKVARETWYEILGTERTANPETISSAYRKKAKEWHPDVSKHPKAKETFVKIQMAYEVLKNAEKRKQYDDQLSAALGEKFSTTQQPVQVVRRRGWRSTAFLVLVGLGCLYYNWNTHRTTGVEGKDYMKNPRAYYEAKNATEQESS